MNNIYKRIAIYFSAGIVLMILLLLFQRKYTLIGWANATAVTSLVFFGVGWVSIIINQGLFTLVVYGVSSFWTTMFGKKKEKTYYETVTEREPIKKEVYLSYWLVSMIFLIVTIILHYIYYKTI